MVRCKQVGLINLTTAVLLALLLEFVNCSRY